MSRSLAACRPPALCALSALSTSLVGCSERSELPARRGRPGKTCMLTIAGLALPRLIDLYVATSTSRPSAAETPASVRSPPSGRPSSACPRLSERSCPTVRIDVCWPSASRACERSGTGAPHRTPPARLLAASRRSRSGCSAWGECDRRRRRPAASRTANSRHCDRALGWALVSADPAQLLELMGEDAGEQPRAGY